MLSIVGADRAQNQQGQCHHLCEYFQLEQRCKEIMQNKCHVVRVSIFNQLFYFMAPMIEGQGVLRLPIQEGQKWTPVDLQDVIEAFVQLSKRGQQPRGVAFGLEAAKELYQFTPTQVRPINELTREIAQGLDRGELRYETASKEQTRKWLQQMRDDNRFRHRPDNKAESRRDRPFTFPLGRYLNDEMIDTILEVWQLANDGQMDIVTNDLKQVLGKEPQDIKQYFKSNRQQFRDLR
ncbi:hypothetical protein BC940DRAFT_301965 [Gongronella butleri]|nr:hypothetical protein BC940DRAFT_301965 [Gongronella butleri]